jgi:hypothetical protein
VVRSRRGLLVGAVLVALLGAAVLAGVLLVPRSRADVDVTVDPAMVKGPAGARVTIVEFSDYQ